MTRLSVLDLACGKGGDLNKWAHSEVRNYFGVDISEKAVKDAMERKIGSGLY